MYVLQRSSWSFWWVLTTSLFISIFLIIKLYVVKGPGPVRFDFSKWVPTIQVYYQSTCGSCWANATVTALQFRALKLGLVDDEFDVDDVLLNTPGNFGCAGGSIRRAYRYCATTGLSSGGRRYPLAGYRDLTGIGQHALKTEVMDNGPVTAHILEYPSMKRLKPGDVWAPLKNETALGGHAIVIYGWDDARGGWLVQNSWGRNWCDNGRGIFKYGAGNVESMYVFAGDFVLS